MILTPLFSQLNPRVVSPSATRSCNNDTQNVPPSVLQLRYFANGEYCLVTDTKFQLGTAADILSMHILRKGSSLSSDMEGLNQSTSTILMSWMFSRNLLFTALYRANTDRRQKAVNDKLWEFVILLWRQEEYWRAYSAA